jgi:iron complex transport system substrate-binding protein
MFSRRDGNTIERIIKDRNWENIDAHLGKRIFVTPGNYDFFAHHGPSFIREVLPWLASKVPK